VVNNSKNKLLYVCLFGVEKQFLAFSYEKGERFVKEDEQIGPWGRVCVRNAKKEKVHSWLYEYQFLLDYTCLKFILELGLYT